MYKRIDVQIHTHMHIYTHIMSAHIHTWTYIHTRIQNVHMNARKTRLKLRRGSNCAGSPTSHQEALPFSLSASRQRAVQTTSAYLHWCGADPPSSLSTPAPSLAMPAHLPETRSFSCHFGRVFWISDIWLSDAVEIDESHVPRFRILNSHKNESCHVYD